MRAIQFLLTLFGALAVLSLGALPSAAATPPPCHEMGGGVSHETPAKPDKPMKAMGCCVVCVAAPVTPPAADGPSDLPRAHTTPRRIEPLTGLTPAPEPGPPRV